MSRQQCQAGNRIDLTILASTISAVLAGGTQVAHAQQDEITVTGSRIPRRDFTAPSPIVTVDVERLELTSTISLEAVLNQLPQFVPAQSQFSAQGQIQTSPTLSLGIGTVNLRGVSTNRTLVLVDGRRAQPSNASLVVDINTIPSAAIERVETITGGASAVYGADALAGVVNFVLRDDYEGISLDYQAGWTEAGDGEESRFSALVGLNAESGNSNVLLGVEWYEREASFQRNRDFYVDGWSDPTNAISTFFPSMPNLQPAGNPPSQAAVDQVFFEAHGIAPGTVDPNQPIYFNLDGSPFVRQTGQAIGFDFSQLGRPFIGDGFYGLLRRGEDIQQIYIDGPLSTPLDRRSAFGKAHVDINDYMRAFVQANFSRIEVETFSAGPPPAYFGWSGTIPNDNRTSIPSALQTLLDSRGDNTAPWTLSRGLDFLGHFGPVNASDVYQIMVGVEGQFVDRDWTWEAYYSSGETNATSVYGGLPSIQRWQALAAAPEFGAGASIPALAGGGYALNCTSGLPIFFGTTADMSSDCRTSVLGSYKSVTVLKQDILEGNVQGKLLDMASGELRFAAGLGTRKNEFTYDPLNPQSSVFDQPLGLFPSNPAAGKTSVDEIYGELLVPIVERLGLEVGYRYSDYDIAAGSVDTYKALFEWSPTDWLRVRGGYQRANRAPNSAELFQSDTTIFEIGFVGDPCQTNTLAEWGNVPENPDRANIQQLCAALIGDPAIFGPPGSATADSFLLGEPNSPFTGINGVTAGNPSLESEEADTYTLGAVFQGPGRFENLTASIDYYDIEVTGAIGTFSGNAIYEQCFNMNGVSNPGYSAANTFCGLIERVDGTGGPGVVRLTYLNTGFIETAGIDMAVNWGTDLPTGGRFYVNSLVTYIDHYDTQEKLGDPVQKWVGTLGEGGQFRYRINSTIGYNLPGGNANIGLRIRHLPKIKDATVVDNPSSPFLPAESWTNFDFFAGYTINDRYQLRGGIENLFDTDPSVVGATPTDSNSNATLPGYYDTLGRRAFIGVKMVF